MPKVERDTIEWEEEIFGFLDQSNISEKNISRLQTLLESDNSRIAELASIVIEVAKFHPRKKRRLKALERKRQDLLAALEKSGFIHAPGSRWWTLAFFD